MIKSTALLHGLFTVGIMITVVGWFFDRAKSMSFVLSCISSDYINAKQALEDLKSNSKVALTKNHEGFNLLLKKWPGLTEKADVDLIGRSVAYMSFGPVMSNDIQIMAYDKDHNEIGERWKMSDAEATFESIVDKKLFVIGTTLFWLGIIVSIVSYIISSVIKS